MLKRYTVRCDFDPVEDEKGTWVKFEDVVKIFCTCTTVLDNHIISIDCNCKIHGGV